MHFYEKGSGGVRQKRSIFFQMLVSYIALLTFVLSVAAVVIYGAEKAIAIKAGYKPSFDSCEALCRHLDRGDRQLEMVSYDGEGQAHVSW